MTHRLLRLAARRAGTTDWVEIDPSTPEGATTEWSDHIRTSQTTDSYVSRQLLRVEEPKTRASRILRSMASIKI